MIRTSRFRTAALALACLALSSCHSITPYLEAARLIAPQRYVIVLPQERQQSPAVLDFIARKQFGFDVELIHFPTSVSMPERARFVRSALLDHRSPDGSPSYALIIATNEELTMGPWEVEGAEDPVHSDTPYFLSKLPTPLTETAWSEAFQPDFPWIAGRVPFKSEKILRQTLTSGRVFEQPNDQPLAMIGGERFAVWWDTSLIMSSARSRLATRGWRTITYAEDWPCDIQFGSAEGDDVRAAHATATELIGGTIPTHALDGVDGPEDMLFLLHWVHLAPDIVYVNSHGSPNMIGDYLPSIPGIFRYHKLTKNLGLPFSPQRPAVFVNIACSGGVADSDLLRILFARRWICAMVGSTENTAPIPLCAAIRAEVHAAEAIAAGLPLGLAMQAARQSYYADASSAWSYALFSSTAVTVGRNLLGMTIYGDPSILLPARRQT